MNGYQRHPRLALLGLTLGFAFLLIVAGWGLWT